MCQARVPSATCEIFISRMRNRRCRGFGGLCEAFGQAAAELGRDSALDLSQKDEKKWLGWNSDCSFLRSSTHLPDQVAPRAGLSIPPTPHSTPPAQFLPPALHSLRK